MVYQMLSTMQTFFTQAPLWIWILAMIIQLPVVAALPTEQPFPDITFEQFSQVVLNCFSSNISLSTVLLLLFTLTENTDLLSLHARQQNPKYKGEKQSTITGWIKSLARALDEHLGKADITLKSLLKPVDVSSHRSSDDALLVMASKLNELATLLKLYPYNYKKKFQGKLKPVSHKAIQAVHVVCPNAVVCSTESCKPQSLRQITKTHDIPKVTLIKNSVIYENVFVLTGQCPDCDTMYFADHERASSNISAEYHDRVYLNDAKYLKVGQNVWVDRLFSVMALNGMYSFHASAAAYTEFWNNSFWKTQSVNSHPLSRRQVWQAFVQESIRGISEAANINLVLRDGLAIEEVTQEAFNILGEQGVIRSADQHACSECTHSYKARADIITGHDPAALVGVDENRRVPELAGEGAEQAAIDAIEARENAALQDEAASDDAMDIDSINTEPAPVKMVVMDGIVMGPTVGFFTLFNIIA